MANQCSRLNPECIAKKGSPCPALENDKNCWEYDWIPLMKGLPHEEQAQWKSYLADKCPRCPAFCPDMQSMLDRIQTGV